MLASRAGYLTALVPSTPTAATLPGVFHSTKVPEVTGRPMVGRTLHASTGTWSLDGVTLAYQWYAGTTPIKGATEPTYPPTAGGRRQADPRRRHRLVARLHPRVTAASTSTDRVLLGVATVAKPTLTGRAVLGRTLKAHAAVLRAGRGHACATPGCAATSRSAARTTRRTSSRPPTSATASTSR